MMDTLFYTTAALAASAPFVAILFILLHYNLRRARWRGALRRGQKPSGFCPSPSLGSAFQIMEEFYRPSVACVIEAKLEEDVDEDENGDPDTPLKHFHRQLRRIQQGEPVDILVLRL
jgi:hypothetical protein